MTVPAVGTQTVFGLAEESTYGTAVAPSRFHPLISEGLKLEKKALDDPSMYPGGYQAMRDQNRVVTGRSASGDFKLGVTTKSMGLIFKHLLGPILTPTVASQGGSPVAYLHTYLPGLAAGKSLTLQKQLRDNAGNLVGAWDFSGAKFTKGEFSIATNGILQLSIDVVARNAVKQSSPGASSYGTGRPFNFTQALLKLNGTSVIDTVRDASITIERPLDTDRIGLGNSGLMSEPAENDYMKITGKMTSDFENIATFVDRFDSDVALALILEFTGATISGSNPELLRFTLPVIHLDGETPQVGGAGTVKAGVPFTAYYDGSSASVKIEYQTTDAAV